MKDGLRVILPTVFAAAFGISGAASLPAAVVEMPEAIPGEGFADGWWWRSQDRVLAHPEHMRRARRFFGGSEDGACIVAPHAPVCPAPCGSLAGRVEGASSVVLGRVEGIEEGFAGGAAPSPSTLLGVRVEETLRGEPKATGSAIFVRYPNADFTLDGTRFRYVACDTRCRPTVGDRVVLFLYEDFFHEDLRLLVPTAEMLVFESVESGERCESGVPDLELVIDRIRALGTDLAPPPPAGRDNRPRQSEPSGRARP